MSKYLYLYLTKKYLVLTSNFQVLFIKNIFGSVTIIKALAISKVVFSIQNTSIPSDVPELIEKNTLQIYLE